MTTKEFVNAEFHKIIEKYNLPGVSTAPEHIIKDIVSFINRQFYFDDFDNRGLERLIILCKAEKQMANSPEGKKGQELIFKIRKLTDNYQIPVNMIRVVPKGDNEPENSPFFEEYKPEIMEWIKQLIWDNGLYPVLRFDLWYLIGQNREPIFQLIIKLIKYIETLENQFDAPPWARIFLSKRFDHYLEYSGNSKSPFLWTASNEPMLYELWQFLKNEGIYGGDWKSFAILFQRQKKGSTSPINPTVLQKKAHSGDNTAANLPDILKKAILAEYTTP